VHWCCDSLFEQETAKFAKILSTAFALSAGFFEAIGCVFSVGAIKKGLRTVFRFGRKSGRRPFLIPDPSGSSWYPTFWFKLARNRKFLGWLRCPKSDLARFVHYLSEVVGWQLGKWDLGGNIFSCEHNVMCDKGLGRGIILEKLVGRNFLLSRLLAGNRFSPLATNARMSVINENRRGVGRVADDRRRWQHFF
jgi:hypothetical protein